MRGRNKVYVRTAIVLALVALASVLWWWLNPRPAFELESARRAARGRDLVLVTLDTTRYDHLGCYGYSRDTTPAIDDLAARGLRFEIAYASAPVTLPAHTSLLTGQRPPRHGVRNNARYRLEDDALTLAERLREAGYQTAAFISALVLDHKHGLGQGFDYYGDDLSGVKEQRFHIARRDASAVVDEALAWVAKRDPAKPSFLWLHFFDPHRPWTPPPELRSRYGSNEADLYDAEIRAMDDAIGRFREGVSQAAMDPLWIIVSDHGEGLSDHGEVAHGAFVYETTTRIAFILSGRGVFFPKTSPVVARQIDVMPTLLDLLGLEWPETVEGRSLLRVLRGGETPPDVYLEALLGYEEYGWSPVYGLVADGWKLIDAPRPELYHLREDPNEETNLFHRQEARANRMKELLRKYQGEPGDLSGGLSIDPGQREALRSLGYTGTGGMPLEGDTLPDPKDMIQNWNDLMIAKSLLNDGPQRDPIRAFEILEKIVNANPANGTALSMLGREGWREAQRSPQGPHRQRCAAYSRRAFEKIVARAPDRAEGDFGLGLLAVLARDVESAIAHYERALRKEPRHLETLENLNRLRQMREEWRLSVELSSRILALEPEHREAARIGATSHYRLGEYPQAIALLEKLLPARDRAERNGIHFYLGECYRRSGEYQTALTHFSEVREPARTAQQVGALEEQCRRALSAGNGK